MKSSYYNFIIKAPNVSNTWILFNSLSGSIALINQDIKEILEKENFKKLDFRKKKLFEEQGFTVSDSLDERNVVKVLFHQQKSNTSQLELMLNLTYTCNLGCAYCFEGNATSNVLDESSLSHILNFIDNKLNYYQSKELVIQLFGGEPLLAFSILKKVLRETTSLAKKFETPVKYTIFSNGILFNDNIVRELSRYNFIFTQITLDGSKKYHNQRRIFKNKKGTYDFIISSLKKLKETNLNPVIRINIDKKNQESIPDLFRDLKRNNLEEIPIGFAFIRPMTETCRNYPYSISTKEVAEILPGLWGLALKMGLNIDFSLNPTFIYCSAHKLSSYVIDANKNIYKCAGLQGFKKHSIGKITEDGNISKLSPVFYEWMAKDPTSMNPCSSCKILPLCGGGCSGSAFSIYGSYYHNDCFIHQFKITKNKIIFYAMQKGFL